MNTQLFYGKLKYVNDIGDGLQSEDEYFSDVDESNPGLCMEDIYIPETDESCDEMNSYIDVVESKKTISSKKTRKKKPVVKNPTWKKKHLPAFSNENFNFEGEKNLPNFIEELNTPHDIFKFLFTDELISYISEQSNLYALQTDINKPANITKKEIEQFIGK